MAREVIPLDQLKGRGPSLMVQNRQQGVSFNTGFSAGVIDSFPTLSIKGKVFRLRQGGAEQQHVDQNGYPMPYLDVILVRGSEAIAKTYYAKGYSEGDLDPPDCWSVDSVKPDAGLIATGKAVNPVCQGCPMNSFGSRVTDKGKAAKACQDQRRIVITPAHMLDQDEMASVLMRVPQSSLKNLSQYAQKLENYGLEINSVVTRLSFEVAEAFPKLKFDYQGTLTDQEYPKIYDMALSNQTLAMLAAPITEPAEENLGEDQKPRTKPAGTTAAPQRGNVTPFPQHGQQQPQPRPQEPPAPQPAPPPAPQPEPTPPPAAAQEMTTPAVGGLVPLGDGRFYNPITQQLCDAQGHAVVPGATPPAAAPAPEPEVKEAAAPRQRKPRGAAAAAPQAEGVTASAPALDSLLSTLLPK